MRKLKPAFVAGGIAVLISLSSCNEVSLNPRGLAVPSGDIAPVVNVQWTLSKAMIEGSTVHLSGYEPFVLFLGDSSVNGYDGCNWYFGDVKLFGDHLSIGTIFATEMGCGNGQQFDARALSGDWHVDVEDSTLTLTRGFTLLSFSSSYTLRVDDFPFVGKALKLFESNDTSFYTMSRANLLPVLTLNRDRSFQLKWRIQPTDTLFPYNYIGGYFGVSTGQHMIFYNSVGAYSAPDIPPYGNEDLFFQERILAATTFSYSLATVTFSGGKGKFFYTFAAQPADNGGDTQRVTNSGHFEVWRSAKANQ